MSPSRHAFMVLGRPVVVPVKHVQVYIHYSTSLKTNSWVPCSRLMTETPKIKVNSIFYTGREPLAALTVNVCMFSTWNHQCVSMSICLFVSGFGAHARKRKPSGVDAVSVSGVCAFGAFGDVGKSSIKCASSAGATRGLLFLEGCWLDISRYPCAFNHACGLHRICRLSLPSFFLFQTQ